MPKFLTRLQAGRIHRDDFIGVAGLALGIDVTHQRCLGGLGVAVTHALKEWLAKGVGRLGRHLGESLAVLLDDEALEAAFEVTKI